MTQIKSSCPDQVPVILVVDDDRSLRALLKLAMEEEGYQVVEAKNGKECLAEFSRSQPDMVLLDAVMPDMDGFTCCQQLRQLPNGDRLPILMITVLDDRESVERAFASGARDYITKPIHWTVLAQRVRRMLIAHQALLKAEAASQQLQKYQAWEHFLRKILQQLCQSPNLWDILPAIVADIQNWLQVERVIFYQKESKRLIESVTPGYLSVKEISVEALGLETEYGRQYQQERVVAIDNLSQRELPSAILDQLNQLKTEALLIAPVVVQNHLWGSLCAHQCHPRQWDELEIGRFADLANLLSCRAFNLSD